MKVTVTVSANLEMDLSDYLEDDEVLEGSEDAGRAEEDDLEVVTVSDVLDRVREQVDEGDLSMDVVIERASDYTVTVKPYTDGAVEWQSKLPHTDVQLINTILGHVPEAFEIRKRFVAALQKLAGAQ